MFPVSAAIRFEEVSEQAGITRTGESWGNAWGDFDGDGYLDLWTTNHKQKPSLYRNNGDGSFTDIIDTVWDAYPYADAHGAAWADFDNDGDQDLIVLSGGGGATNPTNITHNNHLYVNESGRLVESGAAFGVDLPMLRGRAPLWLDVNGDRQLDLVMTGRTRPVTRTSDDACCYENAGSGEDPGLLGTSLFLQTHNGFEMANAQTGLLLEEDASLAQLADVTGDGTLDLIVDVSPYPGKVYDITDLPFQDITETLFLPKRYYVQDVAFADFNGDLSPDLFLARGLYASYVDAEDPHVLKLNIQTNMGEKGVRFRTEGALSIEIHSVWATQLYHLKIGARGESVTAFGGEYIQTDPTRNVSSFFVDLDPEDPQVIGLAARWEEELYGMYLGYDPETEMWTVLYHTQPRIDTNWSGLEAIVESTQPITDVESINFTVADLFSNPQSTLFMSRRVDAVRWFQDVSANRFLDARSVVAGDFDNDMDVDLYVVRSSSAGNLPNALYENMGNGSFAHRADAGGALGSTAGKGQSVTMADYDRDGYLDLFVTNGRGGAPFNNGPDQLFRNIGSGQNWLQIDLVGTLSNRDGIGARLYATTPDGRTQLRENGGGIHWSQQDQKRIHFGLGENASVSELRIHWPSGVVQILSGVRVNQVLRVVEPGRREAVWADVDGDGAITILDFMFAVRHFGETPLTRPAADVNRDGHVNILDLLWISQILQENSEGSAPAPQDLITPQDTR